MKSIFSIHHSPWLCISKLFTVLSKLALFHGQSLCKDIFQKDSEVDVFHEDFHFLPVPLLYVKLHLDAKFLGHICSHHSSIFQHQMLPGKKSKENLIFTSKRIQYLFLMPRCFKHSFRYLPLAWDILHSCFALFLLKWSFSDILFFF